MNAATQITSPSICNFSLHPVIETPFSHVDVSDFISKKEYAELCLTFPTCPPKVGPTGYSLYWGDSAYDQLLQSHPAWLNLFKTFHSKGFVEWCKKQFTDVFEQEGCRLTLPGTHYVPFCEDRVDKERATLRKIEHKPEELWVRMDIHQGQIGYDRSVHLDHARRLVSMLIYFCDQDENQMVGGELFLHKSKDDLAPIKVTPRHNRMVAFPCSRRSLHSVSKITAQVRPRNYIQVHLSSSVDVWDREPVPVWRRTVNKAKHAIRTMIG